MAAHRRRRQDDVDLDSVMADIYSGKYSGDKAHRLSFFRKKSRKTHPGAAGKIELDNRNYIGKIAGSKPLDSSLPKSSNSSLQQQKAGDKTITIKITGLENVRGRLKNQAHRHRRALKLVFILAIVALLIAASIAIVRRIGNSDKPAYEGEDITPPNVYVPKDLPEGFSVGSGSQELENGAVLYTVYTDKGYQISIVQQNKPDNLNSGLFKAAQSFNTRLGKAYIIETLDRITGYIMADDSMLLFNSTGPISNSDMKKLMEAFQP